MKKVGIVIGILLLVLLVGYLGTSSSKEVVSAADQKCGTDSETYAYKYKLDTGGPLVEWAPIKSHFNTKLSSCLIYIGNTSKINSGTTLSMDKVIDVTHNKVILLSNAKMVCEAGGACVDDQPVESDVSGQLSFGQDYFFEEMAKLMKD